MVTLANQSAATVKNAMPNIALISQFPFFERTRQASWLVGDRSLLQNKNRTPRPIHLTLLKAIAQRTSPLLHSCSFFEFSVFIAACLLQFPFFLEMSPFYLQLVAADRGNHRKAIWPGFPVVKTDSHKFGPGLRSTSSMMLRGHSPHA